MAGPTTNIKRVEAEAIAKKEAAVSVTVDGSNKQAVVPVSGTDKKQQDTKRPYQGVDTDRALRAVMPKCGPTPLAYEDVLDISMYTTEEIENHKDILVAFDRVDHAHTQYSKLMNKRLFSGRYYGLG